MRATGAEPPERVTTATAGTQFLDSWSPDGRHLFYVLPGPSPDDGPSIRRVTFNRGGIEDALVSEWTADPRISPNGRWLAHTDIRACPRREIEIRPFPNWNASRVVIGAGRDPRWRSDGREVYYDDGGTIFAASVDDSNGLQVGKPRKLFEGWAS